MALLEVKMTPDGRLLARRKDGRRLTPEDREEARIIATALPTEEALARFKGRVMQVRVFSKALGREVWVCSNPKVGGIGTDSHYSGFWLVDDLLLVDLEAVKEALGIMEMADRTKPVQLQPC